MIQNVVFDIQQRARLSSMARAALTQQEGKSLILFLNSVPVPQHKLLLAPNPAALLKSETTERQQMTNNTVGSLNINTRNVQEGEIPKSSLMASQLMTCLAPLLVTCMGTHCPQREEPRAPLGFTWGCIRLPGGDSPTHVLETRSTPDKTDIKLCLNNLFPVT